MCTRCCEKCFISFDSAWFFVLIKICKKTFFEWTLKCVLGVHIFYYFCYQIIICQYYIYDTFRTYTMWRKTLLGEDLYRILSKLNIFQISKIFQFKIREWKNEFKEKVITKTLIRAFYIELNDILCNNFFLNTLYIKSNRIMI